MVDKSRRVDVDGSLKEREWDTEEFYAVLNQHTEQVRILTLLYSSILGMKLDRIQNTEYIRIQSLHWLCNYLHIFKGPHTLYIQY